MITIALSAGHNPVSKGASHDGFNEYDEAIIWVAKLGELLALRPGFNYLMVPTGKLTSKINFINKEGRAKQIKLALEVHFNYAGGKGRGSETLYCPGSVKGKAAADTVQKAMASLMPPNRGIKEGWYRQDRPGTVDYVGDVDGDETLDAILVRTFCPTIIIEPEFLQHKSAIQVNRDICCELICDAICELYS